MELDLTTYLERAIAAGVTGVTLYATPGGRWQAAEQRRGAGKDASWKVFVHNDPILALIGSLSIEGRRVTDLHSALKRAVAARS